MRIVVVSDWFAEKMGYIENSLPRALAASGHEVHVITSTAQPYFNAPFYSESYEPFLGPPTVDPETKQIDGFTLHRLPVRLIRGRIGMKGLPRLLRALNPDVVQALDPVSLSILQILGCKLTSRFRLFTANHVLASVYPPAQVDRPGILERTKWFLFTFLPGRIVSLATIKCYAVTPDAADISIRFFGMQPHKVAVTSLGVDTEVFTPRETGPRAETRSALTFLDTDIVCIYTGRMSRGKDPLLLGAAVSLLRARGHSYRGVFVGGGEQAGEIASIDGCLVIPFVPFTELPRYYHAADIGVWPRQESTSMLDAAACGLPIVVSNLVKDTKRYEGNGLTYSEGDVEHLAETLLELVDEERRSLLGRKGTQKVAATLSWKALAEQRVKDYRAAG